MKIGLWDKAVDIVNMTIQFYEIKCKQFWKLAYLIVREDYVLSQIILIFKLNNIYDPEDTYANKM